MVSANLGFHNPLTLKFELIDQIRSLDLGNLYISKFVKKCGVDRARSRNDSETDNRLQVHKYKLEQ